MVKTYQLANKGKYGRMLKVAPVTTESSLNVKTCLALNGTETLTISLQSVIPDISNYTVRYFEIGLDSLFIYIYINVLFQYLGQEVVRGVEAEKWQFKEKTEDKITKYTLYVSYSVGINLSFARK